MANDQRPTTSDLLLYYITDRTAFASDELTRRRRLLEKIAEAARAGIDYIQLRERDLTTRELQSLADETVSILNELRTENQELRTALLINSRTDIALATGADGVHLRSDDVCAMQVRAVWSRSHVGTAAIGCPATQSAAATVSKKSELRAPVIGVSCHSPEEVSQASNNGATFAVFAPVFEKKDIPGMKTAGLKHLREACKAKIPVLALGGVTLENAQSCLEAGASGIAAIRLFQENDVDRIVGQMRQAR
jgi:thiamine-phosphate pyrophosphorylase